MDRIGHQLVPNNEHQRTCHHVEIETLAIEGKSNKFIDISFFLICTNFIEKIQ